MTHDHIDTGDDDPPIDAQPVEQARHDLRDSPSVLEAVLAAVSDLDPAFDPSNSQPVQSTVDVDALERLFDPARDETDIANTAVAFEYDRYRITITAAGTVTATYADSADPSRSSR